MRGQWVTVGPQVNLPNIWVMNNSDTVTANPITNQTAARAGMNLVHNTPKVCTAISGETFCGFTFEAVVK